MMTINVGLIGYGLSGSVFHAPLIQIVEGLTLKSVVSSDAAKVHKDYPDALVVSDVDTLLANEDIQVVVVSSPNTTHYEYAMKSMLAGKHVVVEKPFTVTSAEAEALAALAKDRNVMLTVYHNRRWDNDFLTLKKLLQSGLLGQLSIFESHFDRFRPVVRDRWREKSLPGSGMLYDLGSHLIDQALHLFGKPQRISADLREERAGAETTDYFHLVFIYQDFRVILHSGSLVKQSGPRFVLHGDHGSFIKYGLDPQEDQLKQGIRPGDPIWGKEQKEFHGRLYTSVEGLSLEAVVDTIPGQYEAFYQGVVDTILSGKAAPVLAEEALNTIRMLEYAIQSHKEQRTIQIP
jgi:scyllo-inositol 2-dehydrogenase (NADP+)